jgi:exosome complex component CSL4
MTEVNHGKFVMIGDFIAGAEEYAYEDTARIHEINGKLYASIPGIVTIDPLKRTINLENPDPNLTRHDINPGDLVIGQADFMRKYTVGMQLYKVRDKYVLNDSIYGNIHISNVSSRYIEKIEEAFKKTDIIRAQVIKKVGTEYELTTDGPDLGVISCECMVCGTKMEKKGSKNVECPFCGNKGMRKLSNDYIH